MPRARRGSIGQQPVNIETHPCNEHIILQLRVSKRELELLRVNMPFPELLEKPVHGWNHILHMLVYASELCNYSNFDLEVVKWAILSHDAGRYHDDMQETQHPLMGAYVADKIIPTDGFYLAQVESICSLVSRHNLTDKSTSNEEAALRAADRLDLWRMPNFGGIDAALMDAPGWRKVEKIARQLCLAGEVNIG